MIAKYGIVRNTYTIGNISYELRGRGRNIKYLRKILDWRMARITDYFGPRLKLNKKRATRIIAHAGVANSRVIVIKQSQATKAVQSYNLEYLIIIMYRNR